MPINVLCGCGKKLRAGEQMLGKKVRCPNCQAIVTVLETPAAQEDNGPLLELLKQPGCTDVGRAVLLMRLGQSSKRTFRTVWDLVEYIERHDPERILSAPLPRRRQIPRPTAATRGGGDAGSGDAGGDETKAIAR
jgi:hypothetical protein